MDYLFQVLICSGESWLSKQPSLQHHRWPNDLQATLRRLPPSVDVIDKGMSQVAGMSKRTDIPHSKVGTLSVTEPNVEHVEDQLGALQLSPGHSTRSQILATMAPISDSGPLIVEVLESECTNRPTDKRSEEDPGTGGNSSTRSGIIARRPDDVFFLLRSAFLNGELSEVNYLEDDKAARALDILHKVGPLSITFCFLLNRQTRDCIRSQSTGLSFHTRRRGSYFAGPM